MRKLRESFSFPIIHIPSLLPRIWPNNTCVFLNSSVFLNNPAYPISALRNSYFNSFHPSSIHSAFLYSQQYICQNPSISCALVRSHLESNGTHFHFGTRLLTRCLPWCDTQDVTHKSTDIKHCRLGDYVGVNDIENSPYWRNNENGIGRWRYIREDYWNLYFYVVVNVKDHNHLLFTIVVYIYIFCNCSFFEPIRYAVYLILPMLFLLRVRVVHCIPTNTWAHYLDIILLNRLLSR